MVEQLRTLLAQNPTALQPLIQAIAQSNPQLAQAMAQDPEGVLEMLAQGAEGGAAGEGEALVSFWRGERWRKGEGRAREELVGKRGKRRCINKRSDRQYSNFEAIESIIKELRCSRDFD